MASPHSISSAGCASVTLLEDVESIDVEREKAFGGNNSDAKATKLDSVWASADCTLVSGSPDKELIVLL